jgi:putative ABC transport system ATP-binding protein
VGHGDAVHGRTADHHVRPRRGRSGPDGSRGRLPFNVTDAAPVEKVRDITRQHLGLLDKLSIAENVDLPLRLGGREGWPDPDRLEVALRAFGLESMAHRMPWEVSLGEQQRTALARALVLTPKLLLADEPTGHQDAAWATGVMDGLRKACAAGTAVLVATHDDEVIAQIPKVLRMRDGRLA